MKRILLISSMIFLWSSNANSQWSIQGDACVRGYKVDCSAEFKRHDNHDTVLTNIFKRCVRRQALPRMRQQSRLGVHGASRDEIIRLARTICNESAEVQIQLENTKAALDRLKSCMCKVGCRELGYLRDTVSMCSFDRARQKTTKSTKFYERNATYIEVQSLQELSGIEKSGRYIWKFERFKGNNRLGRGYEIPKLFHRLITVEKNVRLKQGKDTTGWDCDTISRVVDLKYKNAYVVSCDNYQNHFRYNVANRKFSICQAEGKSAKGSCFK